MADREIDKWNPDRLDRLREREQELLNALVGSPNKATLKRADKALHAFLIALVGEDVPLLESWRFANSD